MSKDTNDRLDALEKQNEEQQEAIDNLQNEVDELKPEKAK